MIYAITLAQTDDEGGGTVIYTSKVASFEYEHPALDFAKGKDDIMLIDSDGRILKDATVVMEQPHDH